MSECTNREVLKTEVVQKLSKQARAYICAYFILHQRQQNNKNALTLTLPLIDHLMKIFKTHQAAMDFDAGFVQSVVPTEIEDVICLSLKKTKLSLKRLIWVAKFG